MNAHSIKGVMSFNKKNYYSFLAGVCQVFSALFAWAGPPPAFDIPGGLCYKEGRPERRAFS